MRATRENVVKGASIVRREKITIAIAKAMEYHSVGESLAGQQVSNKTP